MSATGNREFVKLARAATFSSSFCFFDEALGAEGSLQAYGSLYGPLASSESRMAAKKLGCNFRLVAYFEGPVDPMTGMIINLVDVDLCLKEVVGKLDHFHLNDLQPFRGVAPTPERIAIHCYEDLTRVLSEKANQGKLLSQAGVPRVAMVRLFSGEDSWVDFPSL